MMLTTEKKGGQVLYIALGKIVAMLISFSMPVFLTRFLSKEDYGLYSQFYTITLFLTLIASFGLPASLFFFFPSLKERDRGDLIRNVYASLIILALVILLIIQIPLITDILFGESELIDYINLISICILFILPTEIIEPLYTVNRDNKTALFYRPLEVTTKMISVIVAALIGGNLRSVLIGVIINHFILFLFVSIYAHRLSSSFSRLKKLINIQLLREQINYSLPFGLAIIMNALTRHFDKIVAITFLSVSDYAIYTIAFFGIPGVMQIYDSLCNVYVIKMTKLFKIKDFQEMLRVYNILVTKTLSFSVPLILIVFLYAKEIVLFLFTTKYLASVPLFRVYILYFILAMFGAGLILRATANTKLSFRAYLYSSIISIPFTYFMIKSYGIYGGVVSAIISQSLPKVFQIIFEIRITRSGIKEYLPWLNIFRILLVSLVCLVPFVVIYYISDFSIYLNGVLALIYLLFVYLIEINIDVFIVDKKDLMVRIKMLKLKNATLLNSLSNLIR